MKTLKITQLKQNLIEVFSDCQAEDFLITRWGNPWIVLIGEPRALYLHNHKEKYDDLPEGIPIFVVILIRKDDSDQD